MTHSFPWFLQIPSPSTLGATLRSYMGFCKPCRPIATPKPAGCLPACLSKVESHSEGAGESPYANVKAFTGTQGGQGQLFPPC